MRIGLSETLSSEHFCSECGGARRLVSGLSPIDFHHSGPCDLHDQLQVAMVSDKERFKRYGAHTRPLTEAEKTLANDAGRELDSHAYVMLRGGSRGITGFFDPQWLYVGVKKSREESNGTGDNTGAAGTG